VRRAIISYLEAAKAKDFAKLASMKDEAFTKFSDGPPYHRLGPDEANALEQLQFASLADMSYEIEELRISRYGDVAIASFVLILKGMLVDNYSFRGSLHRSTLRATMVLRRTPRGWLHVHHHFSPLAKGERSE
jgi:ketosteroid isomerase-like protein